ncbi:alpha/beta fold hydrolase [Nocardia harenae]|uniref:alpha/beta fold hydrolase n=1 Tax=Nocardia harenae TaxID=358707 RepID=UPI00082B18CD|nr:alpha/beta hydrolase [Nocardia harenae]
MPDTATVATSGATITYDVHHVTGSAPALFVLGSPMEAAAFGTLAGYFTDRTVLTYDPRGTGRSPLAEPGGEADPAEHADDLRAVLEAAALGPIDVFATSGGAVNALAWIGRHRPESVRTLVAHEPPVAQFLPDRETVLAVCADIYDTYQAKGEGAAMAKFIALVSQQGPLPAGYADAPGPDPAAFGLPDTDDGSRTNPLLGLNMRTCMRYDHDLDALRAAQTRIVLASGAESGASLAARGAETFAAAGGFEHVVVPGGHTGFLGGEYGQQGEPEAFAAALRDVLAAAP